MKGVLAAWLVACFLVSVAAVAGGVLTPDATTYDFGTLLEGQVVDHAFVLANTGNSAVTVTKVETSCPCTTASPDAATVQPGGTTRLSVRFASNGFHGRVAKGIYVSYSAQGGPAYQRLDLVIYATVVERASCDVATGNLDLDFYLLIDLRSAQAYAARHLLGALSIPYDQLASWVGRLPRGVFALLYDQSGTVAATAARTLRNAGYPDVQYLQGGLDSWTTEYPRRFGVAGPRVAERFLLSPGVGGPGMAPALTGVDAAYLRQNYLVLVDLRSPEAYAAAHFAGAVNVAPADLLSWAGGLPMDGRVVLYDEDGSTARGLAIALCSARYVNAQALFGGMAEWRETFGDKDLVTSVIP